jgi:hypothetical protein
MERAGGFVGAYWRRVQSASDHRGARHDGIAMLNGETEQKLSLLARQVWAGNRRDQTLQERLLRDPKLFLQENGIAIPEDFEPRVSVGVDSVSFRFQPRTAPAVGDGSLFFRFEFQWIWD